MFIYINICISKNSLDVRISVGIILSYFANYDTVFIKDFVTRGEELDVPFESLSIVEVCMNGYYHRLCLPQRFHVLNYSKVALP